MIPAPKTIAYLLVSLLATVPVLSAAEQTPAERGRDVLYHKALNPPIWSRRAYDNVWKVWGLTEKPADHDAAFRARYGLHPAPFDNKGLPLGLQESTSLLNKGFVNNCLMCHAGTVAGQTIIGLANSTLDMQSLFDELSTAEGFRMNFPFPMSVARGTVDPINTLTFLMNIRDPDLNLRESQNLGYTQDVASDPPAWWLLKRKKTRDWTGGIDARASRVDMVNLLTPLNSASYIKKQEAAFADIGAFLLTVEAPKYPFPIDHTQAARGKVVYDATCARCHGTPGPDGKYPNRIVAYEELGTDRLLGDAMRPELRDVFNRSWFAQEKAPDGQRFIVTDPEGYQAPPLDGIWATAPYFHNSSVPTLYHVVNSKARPRFFTRTYRTGKDDYDTERVGLKFTVLEGPADSALTPHERRKVYDTTQPGRGNGGHTFGDKLTEKERADLLEYLKTF